MRHGSLFSGIGGFDLAAEWMGWDNVFHCEINPFGQKVLKHYWPDAKSYSDITKTDFTEWNGKVDIVSGGFPCQPYSQAGKRKGKEDDRHLWPEMLRTIREVQPHWIIGENVPGLLNWKRGMVLDEIRTDLEAAGFEVFPPLVLPACAKDAPHRRDRVWIIAHANDKRLQIKRKLPGLSKEEEKTRSGFKRRNGLGQIWSKSAGYVEPPICRAGHGLSDRVDRLRALGNAIVPQVAYEIFKAIEAFETQNLKP